MKSKQSQGCRKLERGEGLVAKVNKMVVAIDTEDIILKNRYNHKIVSLTFYDILTSISLNTNRQRLSIFTKGMVIFFIVDKAR